MEKEFVPYEIALAMKELGFDKECFACYTKDKEISLDHSTNKGEGHYFQDCAAPLYQQAFRWFREKGLEFQILKELPIDSEYQIQYRNGNKWDTYLGYRNLREAQDACLKKLIEIVKENL